MAIIKQDYGEIGGGIEYTIDNCIISNDKLIQTLTEFFDYTPDQDVIIQGTILSQNNVSSGNLYFDTNLVAQTYSSIYIGYNNFGLFVPKDTQIHGYTHSSLYVYSME